MQAMKTFKMGQMRIVQKLHDMKGSNKVDEYGINLTSTYGCIESPSALALDNELGLLCIGTEKGKIKIYGAPGVVFTAQISGSAIVKLAFLPDEGRFISCAADGSVSLFEYTTSGTWIKCSQVELPTRTDDHITTVAIGNGIIYVGSSSGILRQIAVKDSRLSVGDEVMTALTHSMVVESIPMEKRSELGGEDCAIVSLEFQPGGTLLLIGYAGGCVAVAVPQQIVSETTEAADHPEATDGEQVCTTDAAVTDGDSSTKPPTVEPAVSDDVGGDTSQATEVHNNKGADVVEPEPALSPEEPVPQSTPTPKPQDASGKRATLRNLKETFSRTIRKTDTDKKSSTEPITPPLPVPPPPRISHLLLRDQPVKWATWRATSTSGASNEVTVAYGDGAFQVWPVTSVCTDDDALLAEPQIVSKRDPPSVPYGPLPCGAIEKILFNPGPDGTIFTAFSGGLPRPQYEDRYAVTVLQDQEHHVCFHFGSAVKDFVFVPSKPEPTVTDDASATAVHGQQSPDEPIPNTCSASLRCAQSLIVLTEQELIAVDLTQPGWPTIPSPYLNCLSLCSSVTCVAHVANVPATLFSKLRGRFMSEVQTKWPIWAGSAELDDVEQLSRNERNDIALLGHASGSISLVAVGRGDSHQCLGVIQTATLFSTHKSTDRVEDETWPPFRHAGLCIPPNNVGGAEQDQLDVRLSISHLTACVYQPRSSGDSSLPSDDGDAALLIVAGGSGGQVSVWSTEKPVGSFEPDVACIQADLLEPYPNYSWQGPVALQPLSSTPVKFTDLDSAAPLLHPHRLIQLHPPTPITCTAIDSGWHVMAVASIYGYALVDLLAGRVAHTNFSYVQGSQPVESKPRSVQNALSVKGQALTSSVRKSFRKMKQRFSSMPSMKSSTSEPTAAPSATEDGADNKSTDVPAVSEVKEDAPASDIPPAYADSDEKEEKTADVPVVAAAPETDTTEVTDGLEPTSEEKPPENIVLNGTESSTSCVYSLLFVDTYVRSPVIPADAPQKKASQYPIPPRIPSLWVGFADGKVLAHCLEWDRNQGPISIPLSKQIDLRLPGTVFGLFVIDASSHEPITHSNKYRTSHEPHPTEPEQPQQLETDSAEQKLTEEPKQQETQEKDGTSNAAPAEGTHQLIICTEDQIKLFSLPALRALHKYRTADRSRILLPLGLNFYGRTKSSTHNPPAATTAKPDEETVETKVEATDSGDTSTAKVDDTRKTATATAPPAIQKPRKLLTGIGLHCLTRAGQTEEQPVKYEWIVTCTRLDGQMCIHSLPNLRKLHKVPTLVSNVPRPLIAMGCHDATAAFFYLNGEIVVNEFGPSTKLSTLVSTVPSGKSQVAPTVTLSLPAWARPTKSDAPVTVPEQIEPDAADSEETPQPAVDVNETIEPTEPASAEPTPAADDDDKIKKYDSGEEIHADDKKHPVVGDITMDSVKEYFNGEGLVTIKTVETSSEKRTLVEGGHVETTLHETEKIDGKLVKDDIVKLVSEGGTNEVEQTSAEFVSTP